MTLSRLSQYDLMTPSVLFTTVFARLLLKGINFDKPKYIYISQLISNVLDKLHIQHQMNLNFHFLLYENFYQV